MSIRDYPGFKWSLVPTSNGDTYDVWESTFCPDAIMSSEGRFFNISDMYTFDTVHEAMEYIRHKAMIQFFDEN